MRRRLYFIFPDPDSARQAADNLLLARIDDRHMHFLARRGTDLGELRAAGYLMKSDALHGAAVGLGLGALGGLLLGAAILLFPIEGTRPHPGLPFIAVLVGCLLGAWVASMVGSSVPNSRLKQFQGDIEAGKVLMMVDVPYGRVEGVRQIVTAVHPEVVPAGQARPYLVFP